MNSLAVPFLATATLIGLTTGAFADRGYPLGFGTHRCKDWTASRATGGERAAYAQHWVWGFFSGYNAFGRSQTSVGSQFLPYDERNLVDWMDRRCADKPGELVESAAEALILELNKGYRQHLPGKTNRRTPR